MCEIEGLSLCKSVLIIGKRCKHTKMIENYRNNGSIGALLDEYEKALNELIETINDLSEEELAKTVDFETDDQDCKSIQSILTHVVQSGFNYVIETRKSLGENIDFLEYKTFKTTEEYSLELKKMFRFNEKLFNDYPNLKIEEFNPIRKILVRWGQRYDIEQLCEHAIIHILRHRRQIERFIIKLN